MAWNLNTIKEVKIKECVNQKIEEMKENKMNWRNKK